MDCIPKAALYLRVSTEEQASEGQSISAQLETLKQYCRLYHIEIHDVYEDPGFSGKDTLNRPGLQRLLADAECRHFNMVLVWKLSRLSRNLKDLLGIIDLFEQKDIVFSSYSEKFDTSTPVGRMTLQLLGSIAEFERNTIIDNVKLGLQEYARRGGKTGTVLGYDSVSKQLVVNSGEAAVVKMIYHLYVNERQNLTEIANHLNGLGCLTKRGKPFRKDGVSVILGNPVYIGQNRHQIGTCNEYCIPGSHPPIVEQELWRAAQSLRNRNKQKRQGSSGSTAYPLSGKLLCPVCGKRLQGSSSLSKGKTYRYYRCKDCKFSHKAEWMESAVQEMLQKESLQFKDRSRTAKVQALQQQIDLYTKELNRNINLLDKYLLVLDKQDIAENGIPAAKIKQLSEKIQTLQQYIENTNKENGHKQGKDAAQENPLSFRQLDSVELLPDATIHRINFV